MDFEKLIQSRNACNSFARELGIEVTEIRPGYARGSKSIREMEENHAGVPHGGVYFSLADTVCGSAAASRGYHCVTLSCSYNFLRSARMGDTLTDEAREVKAGRSISVYDVQITDQNGTLLGTGTFTFFRLDKKIEL